MDWIALGRISCAGLLLERLFCCKQTRPLEQCVRVRIAAHEATIKFGRVFAIAARENVLAEARANLAAEHAPGLKHREGVGVQYLGPLVGIVAGPVSHRAGRAPA